MSSAIYQALTRSELLGELKRAFRDATGFSLKLVRNGEPQRARASSREGSAFCALLDTNPRACAACLEIQRDLHRRLGRKLASQETCCFAGMVELAVPVVVGGEHVATLLGGQVFRQKPGRRQFDRVARQLREWGIRAKLARIKQAYFRTPVVSEKQLEGAVRLLTILAKQLAESTTHDLLGPGQREPSSVTQAKRFVHAQAGEPLTLRQTAAHVNVSRHHFCKIFKRTTGLTFTEFLACVRVEKAKRLLNDARLRITEVAGHRGILAPLPGLDRRSAKPET